MCPISAHSLSLSLSAIYIFSGTIASTPTFVNQERYATHFYRMVELSASSEAAALAIAEAGLAEIQNRLEFAFTSDGEQHALLTSIINPGQR